MVEPHNPGCKCESILENIDKLCDASLQHKLRDVIQQHIQPDNVIQQDNNIQPDKPRKRREKPIYRRPPPKFDYCGMLNPNLEYYMCRALKRLSYANSIDDTATLEKIKIKTEKLLLTLMEEPISGDDDANLLSEIQTKLLETQTIINEKLAKN